MAALWPASRQYRREKEQRNREQGTRNIEMRRRLPCGLRNINDENILPLRKEEAKAFAK
jgi:hypothetical protein